MKIVIQMDSKAEDTLAKQGLTTILLIKHNAHQ